MNHLERDRGGANIRVHAELFLSYFFCLPGLIIMKRKARHGHKEPQISQTGEEKQSKKH